uniref:Uncharacterized protein n=1 Tax=Nelumbo nucifera TaxID=4432 RepID=A0A822XQB8_NELNU|nr:TPA_asm: hypothetical protein HUJ06_023696 [Nelumbo nucifera]DAD22246.1 TPA_asm: hypothetical protein HUJ06_023709 [Nelumbo nucifera]DAD22250.1 TPA_asm: hypothetical protein HUJ06_023713 [Nelumbo nucifera]DAD22257.1 TPA_asm: hypothetical protein HUJ06_023720 [Nelumbo nucifera]DAD22259.1 TPA_asm: hypothetical protein HUJ06_023722 [Nelumbo nucifera]
MEVRQLGKWNLRRYAGQFHDHITVNSRKEDIKKLDFRN